MAQTSGGPDAYGYTWKNSNHATAPPVFKWIDISATGTQVTGLADDNVVGPFTASNGFQFYWYNCPEFHIGSNGYITLNGDNIASPFPASIPLSAGSNDFIAPLLADLNFSGTGNNAKCYYYSNADTLCVSYIDVPFWIVTGNKQTGRNSFQIILNKADKSITFNYLITDWGTKTSVDDIVGIENVTGTLGLSSIVDALPADTFCIRYYYPSVVTYQAIDGGMAWNDNAKNGGIFIKKGAPAMPLTANVKNFGNTSLSSFTVYDTIYNAAGSAITNSSVQISGLAAGKDTTLVFSNSFTAPQAGIYRFRTAIGGLTGDLVATNNFIDHEIVSVDTTAFPMVHDYSDGTPDGTGLGWNGGDGGIGLYIQPAIYPARVLSSRFRIHANATPPVGYYAKIYDDDGPNGDRGTLLDSVFVPGNTITTGVYKTIPVASPFLTIDSGGLYLIWQMDSASIDLARDLTRPISRRTYEILGPGWSGYRRKFTEDFLMGLNFDYAYPHADFTPVTGFDPSISFFDISTNDPTAWLWEFGDGDTSSLMNPVHVYDSNATYDVCLTAYNAWGSDSVCKKIVISKVMPVADFVFSLSSWPSVIFTDKSTGPPTSWEWDFGDGTIDTIQHPVHTYQANGIYSVCLEATNANGSSAPYCDTVEITGIGMEEAGRNGISIYPNPTTGLLYIKGGNGKIIRMIITDLQGRKLTDRPLRRGESEIDISGFAPGTYQLTFYRQDGSRAEFKLLKE